MKLSKKICAKFKSLNKTDYAVTPNERYALVIVRKLLEDESNELLLHPSLEKRYIKSDNSHMYVVIESDPNTINIINHKYSYMLHLGNRTHKNIVTDFDNVTEKRRLMMENDFISNIEHSLKQITKEFGAKKD